MADRTRWRWVGAAALVVLGGTPAGPAAAQKPGITHTALLKTALPGTADQEVVVWDTRYAPGAINARHMHPAAITFHVLSGTGIWQEEGKPPVTLRAGDSLFVPAGTVHTHWNPSKTEELRFLEFSVAGRGEGHAVPRP
jgi:quercetin dioxygenase-like cupin family protein